MKILLMGFFDSLSCRISRAARRESSDQPKTSVNTHFKPLKFLNVYEGDMYYVPIVCTVYIRSTEYTGMNSLKTSSHHLCN